MNIDVTEEPHTKEVLLDGLRQALQARVATIWNNVTLAGEVMSPEARFADGVRQAVKFYEQAWKAINEEKYK